MRRRRRRPARPRPGSARTSCAARASRPRSAAYATTALRERVLAAALKRSRAERRTVVGVLTRRGLEGGHGRLADGQRAGLVERDDGHGDARVRAPRRPDQDAVARAGAGARHDRRRRRESERARTRDDQHRDRVEQRLPPSRRRTTPQARKVSAAIASTTGTKTALTRSTSRWIGALAACASSTMRMMRASVDSAPTAVVRTTSAPSALTEPPVTRSPGALGDGQALAGDERLVDVARALDHLAVDRHALARPHDHELADAHARHGHVALRAVGARTRAVSGRSAASARIASVVCRLARASSHLPSSTSVITDRRRPRSRDARAVIRVAPA